MYTGCTVLLGLLEKEVCIVNTTAKLQVDNNEFEKSLKLMDEYIEKLINQPPKDAQKSAKAALKRTGVNTQKGNLKKKIVSWE